MKHQKITNILTLVLFVVPLALGLLLFAALPDQKTSEQENRPLKQFPKLTWESLTAEKTERKFSSQMNEYFADQFPARDAFVGIKGVSELLLGKRENNGVILGKDGQLAVRLFDIMIDPKTRVEDIDYYSKELVGAQTDALNALSADLAADGKTLTVIIPPRTLDVVGGQTDYPMQSSDALWQDIRSGIDASVIYPDLRGSFQDAYESGAYVYYRTDHHWTTKGAYLAYCELMQSWGREDDIIPESAVARVETVEGFYGTTWSSAGFKFVAPDQLEIWHFEGEDQYTVTEWVIDTDKKEGTYLDKLVPGSSFQGFYNRDYLEQKDKYSVFLDGTHTVMTVTKNTDEQRPTLLVFKDSFFNSMVPFLAQHYDLVVINLSVGYTEAITETMEKFGCDDVLIVYNAANIITSNSIETLRYEK